MSGEGALRQIKNGKVYSLIITDLSMPVLDGYQTATKIRNFYTAHNLPQPVIIACTGHTEHEYIEKAWRHKINEVLAKPMNVQVAKEILKDFIITL